MQPGSQVADFYYIFGASRNKRFVRVTIGYAAAAWLLAQLADLIPDAIGLLSGTRRSAAR